MRLFDRIQSICGIENLNPIPKMNHSFYPNLGNEIQIQNFQRFNESNFVRLTRQLYRQVTNNMNARLLACGYTDISARHLSVFDHLDAGGTNIVTLANRAGMTKQAMSKLVREASQAGYVTVESDDSDFRISKVRFNEKGLEFLAAFQSEVTKIRTFITKTDYLSNDDLAGTMTTLSKLLNYFEITDDIFNLESRVN
jgi:DNA-binding MarR family transcriptional regulator